MSVSFDVDIQNSKLEMRVSQTRIRGRPETVVNNDVLRTLVEKIQAILLKMMQMRKIKKKNGNFSENNLLKLCG